MSQVAQSQSVIEERASVELPSFNIAPPVPSIARTLGTSLLHWDEAKACVSNKPLRIRRGYEDASVTERVNQLAEDWLRNRPRGADISEMIEHPSYQKLTKMGQFAVRPLLLLIKNKPDHWFAALEKITHANPVPPDVEGRIDKMSEAWIEWGKAREYITDLD